jgi:3-dehydroquinate synthetase
MIADTLIGLGLPTEIPSQIEPDLIETAMRVDKKRAGGVVRFALPVRLGEVKVGVEVGDMRFLFSRRVS